MKHTKTGLRTMKRSLITKTVKLWQNFASEQNFKMFRQIIIKLTIFCWEEWQIFYFIV